jgi:hypothetical protein
MPREPIAPSLSNISVDLLKDITHYAETEHRRQTADPDEAYYDAWIDHQALGHSRDRFTIPGDRTSARLGRFADAARLGNRTREYVAPLVDNWNGYIQRSLVPLVDEVEECEEQRNLELLALHKSEDLIDDLWHGSL